MDRAGGSRRTDVTAESDAAVLYVGDEEETVDALRDALRRADDRFDVDTAGDGAEALEALASRPIDCLVTDGTLPDRTAVELVESVAANRPTVPTFLIGEDVAEGREGGARFEVTGGRRS